MIFPTPLNGHNNVHYLDAHLDMTELTSDVEQPESSKKIKTLHIQILGQMM